MLKKVDKYVQQRLIEHAFRRAGQHENGLCRQPADNHQSHAEHRAECDNSVQRAVDLLAVVLPDEQREHGIRPDRQSDDQVDKNTDERHTAADRRQRRITRKPADNGHICRVEKLLQNAAERQRQREKNEFSGQTAVQHVHFLVFCLCHETGFSLHEGYSIILSCGGQRRNTRETDFIIVIFHRKLYNIFV